MPSNVAKTEERQSPRFLQVNSCTIETAKIHSRAHIRCNENYYTNNLLNTIERELSSFTSSRRLLNLLYVQYAAIYTSDNIHTEYLKLLLFFYKTKIIAYATPVTWLLP